jgi:hypothetical protein
MEPHYHEIHQHAPDLEQDGGVQPQHSRRRGHADTRGARGQALRAVNLALVTILMAVLFGVVLREGRRPMQRRGSTSEMLSISSSSQNRRRAALSGARKKGGQGILDISEHKIADLMKRIEALGLRAVDATEGFIGGSGRSERAVNTAASKMRFAHFTTGTRATRESHRMHRRGDANNLSSSLQYSWQGRPLANRTLHVKTKTRVTKLYRARRGTFDPRTGVLILLKSSSTIASVQSPVV